MAVVEVFLSDPSDRPFQFTVLMELRRLVDYSIPGRWQSAVHARASTLNMRGTRAPRGYSPQGVRRITMRMLYMYYSIGVEYSCHQGTPRYRPRPTRFSAVILESTRSALLVIVSWKIRREHAQGWSSILRYLKAKAPQVPDAEVLTDTTMTTGVPCLYLLALNAAWGGEAP